MVTLTEQTEVSSRHSSLSYLRIDPWDPAPFQGFAGDGTRNASSVDGQVGLTIYFRSALSVEKVFIDSYGVFELLGETGGFFVAIFGVALMLLYVALYMNTALAPCLVRRGVLQSSKLKHLNYQLEEGERILVRHIIQSLLDTDALNAEQTAGDRSRMLEKLRLCELPIDDLSESS